MRFDSGEAFVPILQRDAGMGGKPFGKFVNIGCLAALMTAHVDRIPHEQKGYFALRHKGGERGHILTDIGAFQSGKSLRGDAQGIAERQSDPLFP